MIPTQLGAVFIARIQDAPFADYDSVAEMDAVGMPQCHIGAKHDTRPAGAEQAAPEYLPQP